MIEPAAIWSLQQVILDKDLGTTQNVILHQARYALGAVASRIHHLSQICGPRVGNKMFVNQSIPSILQDLCSHAGIASNILFNGNQRKTNFESETAYNLRMERFQYVQTKCEKANFQPILLKDRDIRNALLHIDEKLADILTAKENVGWMIDQVSSTRMSDYQVEGGQIEVKFCRSYIHNEGKIVHLDHELDIEELKKECEDALRVIFRTGINLA